MEYLKFVALGIIAFLIGASGSLYIENQKHEKALANKLVLEQDKWTCVLRYKKDDHCVSYVETEHLGAIFGGGIRRGNDRQEQRWSIYD